MKIKIIIGVFLVLVVGVPVGMYVLYSSYLRYRDDYTSCPVKAFRSAVTAPAAARTFATETSFGTLAATEKCSLDCKHGNAMACAVYGVALQEGIYVMQDRKEARNAYQRACDRGESIGCGLAQQVDAIVAEEKQAKVLEEKKKANAGKIVQVDDARKGAALRKKQALDHFKGKNTPNSGAMIKWYNGTVHFLLYEKPMLSQMHQIPGTLAKDLDLKPFVLAKYVSGPQGLKLDEMLAFFDEFRRLGVLQIRLDHYVEKKKESQIPKTHNYFRAKHTFLYHVADVELAVLETVDGMLKNPS